MTGMDKTKYPRHGYTQREMLDTLMEVHGGYDYARAWGACVSHRQACVRLLRDVIFEMLDDPTTTRATLRREVEDAVREIEERGP